MLSRLIRRPGAKAQLIKLCMDPGVRRDDMLKLMAE
jgi:hypothetical protein